MRRSSRNTTDLVESIRSRSWQSTTSEASVLPQTVDPHLKPTGTPSPTPAVGPPTAVGWSMRRKRKPLRPGRQIWRVSWRRWDRCSLLQKTALVATAAFASLFASSCFLLSASPHTLSFDAFAMVDAVTRRHGRNLESIVTTRDFSVVFASSLDRRLEFNATSRRTMVLSLAPLDEESQLDAMHRDDGGLEIKIPEEEALRLQRRTIYHDFALDEGYLDLVPEDDDWIDNYYAFDDDYNRNPLLAWEDTEIHKTKQCRRTSWHRDLPIDCNKLHEFDVETRFRSGDTSFLGVGAYREAYISTLPYETVVFKAYYWGAEYSTADYEYMRMDAIVSEKLTASPLIVDIYGFCGTAMLNEAMPNGVLQKKAVPSGIGRLGRALDPKDDLVVRSSLSASEKLSLALQMAEGVRVLHSYPDGVMVHDDIQLTQFLLAADGTVKLNDFNRAEIMLWNEMDQEYCRYRNNPGHGDWRAPEEYHDYPLDEKIDIWSLGNNMFTLLTGLYAFYEEKEDKAVQARLKANETAFIDPRYRNSSFADARLVDVIERCWVFDPDQRIDVFDLVTLLQDAIQQNEAREKQMLQMRNSMLAPHIAGSTTS